MDTLVRHTYIYIDVGITHTHTHTHTHIYIYIYIYRERERGWYVIKQRSYIYLYLLFYTILNIRKYIMIIINQKTKTRTCRRVDFAIMADHRMKKTKQKERQILEPNQRIKKVVEHEDDIVNSSNWRAWNGPQGLVMSLEEFEIWKRIETIQTIAL